MPRWLARVLSALVVVALLAAVTVALVQRNDLNAARRRAERLEDALAESQQRIEDLEESAGRPEETDEDGDAGDAPPGSDQSSLGDADIEGLSECLEAGGTVGGAETEGGARSQLQEIAKTVEQIRKLEYERAVKPTFLPPDKVAKRAARLFLEDYPARVADDEQRLLAALGAIPEDMNLRATVKALLESQVAGFYVPENGDLVVPSANPTKPLTPIEKTIIAHELEHALADQRLDLPLDEDPDPRAADESLGALALIEGDATLTMQRYSLAFDFFEQLSMLGDPTLRAAQEGLEGIPHYLIEQLGFPYVDGLEFTCDLYGEGGWKAVNRAYRNPPTTTAHVLFPERYRRDEEAVQVRDPASPGRKWRHVFETSFGAANLMWLFEAPGGDTSKALSDPEGRAAAWGGGEIHLYENGAASAVGIVLAQRKGAAGLCESVATWYDATFDDDVVPASSGGARLTLEGPSQDAVVRCGDGVVRLGIAPDLSTGRSLTR